MPDELLRRRVVKALADVELPADVASRYPNEFSGGQRSRIALARALIMQPALMILDEPTASLDRLVQTRLIALLRRLQAEYQLSYLFISHDLSIIRAMAHRIVVMQAGEIIEKGSCRQIFTAPEADYTRKLIAACAPNPPAPDLGPLRHRPGIGGGYDGPALVNASGRNSSGRAVGGQRRGR